MGRKGGNQIAADDDYGASLLATQYTPADNHDNSLPTIKNSAADENGGTTTIK